jgi:hypothetical protein
MSWRPVCDVLTLASMLQQNREIPRHPASAAVAWWTDRIATRRRRGISGFAPLLEPSKWENCCLSYSHFIRTPGIPIVSAGIGDEILLQVSAPCCQTSRYNGFEISPMRSVDLLGRKHTATTRILKTFPPHPAWSHAFMRSSSKH